LVSAAHTACPAIHAGVPVGREIDRVAVKGLRVTRISCIKATAAIRAGSFAATPAGPRFSTKGFYCTSPVGPPGPGLSAPRLYSCTSKSRREKLTFTVPEFE
jgi:hypothetical protein